MGNSIQKIFFTPASESDDLSRSFSHKRPGPHSDRPEPRTVMRKRGGNRMDQEAMKKETLEQIFVRRQIKYMVGKKVIREIKTAAGKIIILDKEVITESTIETAKQEGMFLELSMNIKIED